MFKPHEKDILAFSVSGFELLYPRKKVSSKPERCERVYKRAAEAQRDLFWKRRRSGMITPAAFQKKSPQAVYSLRRCGRGRHFRCRFKREHFARKKN